MGRQDQAIIIVKEIEKKLNTIYDDPILCRQYAWWLLEEVTHNQKEQLIIQDIILLDDDQEAKLNKWLDKLINEKIPIQYLIGAIPFGNIEILVEPPTLIPRPETEEWVIKLIKKLKQLQNQKITILDIGTGSGCLALALANALPQAKVVATDIASPALALAQKNAIHNGITNVTFIDSDIFEDLLSKSCFDLIVSNPPYISLAEWRKLDESVTQWEDKSALVAAGKGLEIIQTIIKNACTYINPHDELEEKKIPNIWIEIGYQQADAVVKLMEQAKFLNITVEKDLEEKDRVVTGRVITCGPCPPEETLA